MSAVERACVDGAKIHVSWTTNAPYIYEQNNAKRGVLLDIFQKGIQSCCKPGVTISFSSPEMERTMIEDVLLAKPDSILLPVGRNLGKIKTFYGRPFVVFVKSPGIAIVTGKTVSGADLLTAIVNSWPILVFIVTSLSLSGFVVWLLDHGSNTEEFPDFFPLGVFEGFWWAAVTMTTVGYGDKVPRSVPSRLFAVVWINAGLVIIAMFMGIVTSSLSSNMIGNASHLYGMVVSVKNTSVQYQYAVFQSSFVRAKATFEEVYSSVASGESQLALVDFLSSTQHDSYYSQHKLTVASVLEQSVAYGAVLPQHSNNLAQCLRDYQQRHSDEGLFLLDSYLSHAKDPNSEATDGTDYFDGSIFGYSVYAMAGLFLVILAVGLYWQKYHLPRRGEWRESKAGRDAELQDVEIELSTSGAKQQSELPSDTHTLSGKTSGLSTERLMAQQSAELLRVMDEFQSYRQSWEKSFRLLQERHRREQRELFRLDNMGYDM
ncbi:predicted protein [Nematostella vectensis]|uniref:Potassium channel domain-containing protein n=1 Tax=Nematostella vectensis TaxID=45351 RepID=A7S8A5_NEMVE|nr:predicted protein [Nematostella vectensis]|eukprot:XP_001632133.1 predicted protein [Nematostella vectensis]